MQKATVRSLLIFCAACRMTAVRSGCLTEPSCIVCTAIRLPEEQRHALPVPEHSDGLYPHCTAFCAFFVIFVMKYDKNLNFSKNPKIHLTNFVQICYNITMNRQIYNAGQKEELNI